MAVFTVTTAADLVDGADGLLSLREAVQAANAAAGADTIRFASALEGGTLTLTGAGGADRLFGRGGDDLLIGGSGNDLLDGGAGARDVASFVAATSTVMVDLAAGTGLQGTETYTLVGIEAVLGSTSADTLRGDGAANELRGGAGDFVL